ncbi:MAG: peroxiredoxin [Alphaproteobacteria bacterium]
MQEGQNFPDFTLPRDGGETVSLADFAGQKLVLFLYPKDDTPGCTTESIGFSGQLDAFQAAGASVVGMSKNSVKDHDKFVNKFELTVPLLSDESGELLESLGVWVEKKMYGRTYMGIERTTFLIDGTGVIQKIWHKVKVEGHVEDVLKAVQSL